MCRAFCWAGDDTTMNARNDAAGQYLVLPLDKLHLDPENPRLPKGVRTADESAILQWMLVNGCLPGLMESIVSSEYCYAEPLLVVPAQDGYVVVEGNRRLAALRRLHKPEWLPCAKDHCGNCRQRKAQEFSGYPCHLLQESTGAAGLYGVQTHKLHKALGPQGKRRSISGNSIWYTGKRANREKALLPSYPEQSAQGPFMSGVFWIR